MGFKMIAIHAGCSPGPRQKDPHTHDPHMSPRAIFIFNGMQNNHKCQNNEVFLCPSSCVDAGSSFIIYFTQLIKQAKFLLWSKIRIISSMHLDMKYSKETD